MNFYSALTAIFITLKILNYFPYSWWVVFSPVIFQFAMIVVLFLVVIWSNK